MRLQHGGGAAAQADERRPPRRHDVPLVGGGVPRLRDWAPGLREGLLQHTEPKGGDPVRRGAGAVLLPLEEDGETRRVRQLLQNREEEIYPTPRHYRLYGKVGFYF